MLVQRLLACLAIGYGYSFVATGFPVDELRDEVAQLPKQVRAHWMQQMRDWYESIGEDGLARQPFPLSKAERQVLDMCYELAAYDAVGGGVPLLVSLLADADADAELVGQAIYALAWFPEQFEAIGPGLVRIAADDTQPSELVSTALIAFGLVAPRGCARLR